MTPFLHNWASEVAVETAWQTLVDQAEESLAEERSGLVSRPARTLRIRWTGLSRVEGHRIFLALAAAGLAGLDLPLYCDQAPTTAASSATTINCPTTDRRFAVGKRVVIHSLERGRAADDAETPTIQSIAAGALTLAAPLVGTFPAGSLVYPLVETLPVVEPQVTFLSNDAMEIELACVEPIEGSIPALVAAGSDPAGFSLLDQWPIFDVEPNWATGIRFGLVTQSSAYSQGRSSLVEVRGPRPRAAIDFELLASSRAAAFKVLRFFDSRGGRLCPFWLVNPAATWTPTDIAAGYVDVEEAGSAAETEAQLTHVGIVLVDGTVHVREITSVIDNGDTWRIALNPVLPTIDLEDVRRAAPAFFVRFASDTLNESWATDRVCRIGIRTVEVLGEDSVSL